MEGQIINIDTAVRQLADAVVPKLDTNIGSRADQITAADILTRVTDCQTKAGLIYPQTEKIPGMVSDISEIKNGVLPTAPSAGEVVTFNPYPNATKTLNVSGSGHIRCLVFTGTAAVEISLIVDGNPIYSISGSNTIRNVNLAAGGIYFANSFVFRLKNTSSNYASSTTVCAYTLGG